MGIQRAVRTTLQLITSALQEKETQETQGQHHSYINMA